MTGIHVVPAQTKAGKAFYVYAWRGGPLIAKAMHDRPVIDMALIAKANEARREETTVKHFDTLEEVISDYRASPEYNRLRDSTKRDYRLWLDRISERFGHAPLEAFEDRRMRKDIIEWRNQWAS